MSKKREPIVIGLLIAAFAWTPLLDGIGRTQPVPTVSAPGADDWWKTAMANNYWSPQNAMVSLVGKDAKDCGQWGPDATEAQLTASITCSQNAARNNEPFFTIRHYLGPSAFFGKDNVIWLAEGLFGRADGAVRHFDYVGFPINLLIDVAPPPQPQLKESPCSAPHAFRDPSGRIGFACSSPSKPQGN